MKGTKALRITMFVRVWLTVFLALCSMATFSGATNPLLDSEPGPGLHMPPQSPEISTLSPFLSTTLTLLSQRGFSIEGPIQVSTVGSSSISIYVGKSKYLEIGLSGQQMTIKNSDNKEMLLSDIKPLDKIYICRKGNEVVILVLPPKKEEKNA
jgi:hypothetical protein